MLRSPLFICALLLFSSCSTSYIQLMEKGNAHYDAGELNASEEYYKKAYTKDPFKTAASHQLGRVYSNQIQMFDEAMFFFEDALKKEKDMDKRYDILAERNQHLASYLNHLTHDTYQTSNASMYYEAAFLLEELHASPSTYRCPNLPTDSIDHPFRIPLYASMCAFEAQNKTAALGYLYRIDFENLDAVDQDDFILHTTNVLAKYGLLDELLLFAERYREEALYNTSLRTMLGTVYAQLLEELFAAQEYESILLILNSSHMDRFIDKTDLESYYFQISKSLIRALSYSPNLESDVANIRSLLNKSNSKVNLQALYNPLLELLSKKRDFARLKSYVEMAASDLNYDVTHSYLETYYKQSLFGMAQQAYNDQQYENAAYYLNIFLSRYPDEAEGNSLREEVMKLLGRSMLEIGKYHQQQLNFQNAHDSYLCALDISPEIDKEALYGLYETLKRGFRLEEAYEYLKRYRQHVHTRSELASILYELAGLSSIIGEIYTSLEHLDTLSEFKEYPEYREKARYNDDFYNISEEIEFLRWLGAPMRKKLVIRSLTNIFGMDIGRGSSDLFLVVEFDGQKAQSDIYKEVKNVYFDPLVIIGDLPEYVYINVWDHDNPSDWQTHKGNEHLLSIRLNTNDNSMTTEYDRCEIDVVVYETFDECYMHGLQFTDKDYSLEQSDFYLGTKGCWQIGLEAMYKLLKAKLGPVGYALISALEIIASGKNGPDADQISTETQKLIAARFPNNFIVKQIQVAAIAMIIFDTYQELSANNCLF
ncbi:MAG: hypothetical protein AAGA77_05210 [Bacteroidota bacterium]